MKICILGICGTFMAGIALICRDMGYQVAGMDQNVYPPMDDLLDKAGIDIINGYAEQDLPTADIYLVGNAIRRGIPAMELILREKRPYASAPQWLVENILRQRKVIAVAGTHGKTTTTALLTKMFVEDGRDVGYLIAGVAKDFPLPARLGSATEFIIEADEYDTAFFDKRSKFVHYQPDILLINNLEYDHADIFPDLQAIETQLRYLLRSLPSTTQILYPHDNESILRCLNLEPHSNYQQILGISAADELEAGIETSIKTLKSSGTESSNINNSATWSAITDDSKVIIKRDDKVEAELTWNLAGRHNAMNLLFASSAAIIGGVSSDSLTKAASGFQGVARRLEKIGEVQGAEVISDFAHHPTAIKGTVNAIRHKHSNLKLIAIVQLASNSMRLGVHGNKLLAATANADEVFWFAPNELSWDDQLLQEYTNSGRGLYTNSQDLARDLLAITSADNIILIMSNASLAGLPEELGLT
ncbi:MAG: UDP-N-acetylmuramate:L-alanyl-gamma-D-glutamyl-meso-diaminopimelate ligase [Candidatus Portiera sp.]|nr:UDP-N-acetylmuramate:L-alanyl-gamma-D-glutamyl-meso-diaminopimelate ligase [Portiera sp.]